VISGINILMADSEDSEIDVCTIDEESSRNLHTGLTLVAAETFISTHTEVEEEIIPLSDKDLLSERCKAKKSKLIKSSTKSNSQPATNKHVDKVKEVYDIANNTSSKLTLTLDAPLSKTLSTDVATKSADEVLQAESQPSIILATENSEDKELDSEDELFDSGEKNYLNQFAFESDHLAIKNNPDYHALLKTLAVLEAQQVQAIKDLEKLHELKTTALLDPLSFVKDIQEKRAPEFPKRQMIAKPPVINWQHYMTAYSGDAFLPKIATRKSLKEQEKASVASFVEEPNLHDDSSMDSISSLDPVSRSKLKNDDSRHATFNKKWTIEEQEKLEKLLVMFPPEEVEARRWEKIAKALGNRTPLQVSSRIQKYFLKLAKAKLPIPGRGPSASQMHMMKRAKINPVSYKNSTFFPSWQPDVYMDDNDRDNYDESLSHSYMDEISDEEMLTDELKETGEYKELMELKRLKKMSLMNREQDDSGRVVHNGFMCDGCKMSPIIGVRWHCNSCSSSLDFCNNCAQIGITTDQHTKDHSLVPLNEVTEISLADGDYISFEQNNKIDYNYLDPNFLPGSKVS